MPTFNEQMDELHAQLRELGRLIRDEHPVFKRLFQALNWIVQRLNTICAVL